MLVVAGQGRVEACPRWGLGLAGVGARRDQWIPGVRTVAFRCAAVVFLGGRSAGEAQQPGGGRKGAAGGNHWGNPGGFGEGCPVVAPRLGE